MLIPGSYRWARAVVGNKRSVTASALRSLRSRLHSETGRPINASNSAQADLEPPAGIEP